MLPLYSKQQNNNRTTNEYHKPFVTCKMHLYQSMFNIRDLDFPLNSIGKNTMFFLFPAGIMSVSKEGSQRAIFCVFSTETT